MIGRSVSDKPPFRFTFKLRQLQHSLNLSQLYPTSTKNDIQHEALWWLRSSHEITDHTFSSNKIQDTHHTLTPSTRIEEIRQDRKGGGKHMKPARVLTSINPALAIDATTTEDDEC